MFLTQAEVTRNFHWLSDNASPAVRYLTHRDLLHTDPKSVQMGQIWESVAHCEEAEFIFSLQNEDGSWFAGGPWGPRGYQRQTGKGYNITRPKFVTTAWILPFLGEMGFTASDVRIRKSCEHILSELGSQLVNSSGPKQAPNCCGLAAIPYRALASVGMADDERLQAGWNGLLQCQREDGGWLNPRHLADSPNPATTKGRWPWDRSCAWGSYYAAQALFFAHDSRHARALTAALEFLRWHLAQQPVEQVQTWAYHGHNLVKELLMFSEAGLDMSAPPIGSLLGWLRGFYRVEEGCFRTQEHAIPDFVKQVNAIIKTYETRFGANYWKNISKTSDAVLRYHLYHTVEDDWLTYTLTRMGMNLNRSAGMEQ